MFDREAEAETEQRGYARHAARYREMVGGVLFREYHRRSDAAVLSQLDDVVKALDAHTRRIEREAEL